MSVVVCGMLFERTEAPQCRFCLGRLRFDFNRKEKAPGFLYYRCDDCEMPNVFVQPTPVAQASPPTSSSI